MTKAEKLLEKLHRRAKELEILLPVETNKNLYPRDEQDSMLGYRLLCHAEIEGFIEALLILAVEEIWGSAKKSGYITPAAKSMLDFRDKCDFPPSSLRRRPAPPIDRLRGVANDLLNRANKNNGVTEKDVLNLFLPLGIDHASFDTSWLEVMTDFGRSRGDVAHNSWENHTKYDTTPAKERDAVGYALLGLANLVKSVDEVIDKS
ncbi:hypothetical protein ACFYWO_09300 [Streptomyces sp. NPDC002932]|uniref:hypothetical protein n=1 Tax=Streptomyces sp. NPDC002932 TaxID=3364672 RepID=UPI0036C24690